eukprot:FR740619.1.p1 GENE.FR740619.1~~FR740619.1.p1  ORF type:complete len:119 (+),score=73.92 FR740619.1:834-1190(+)
MKRQNPREEGVCLLGGPSPFPPLEIAGPGEFGGGEGFYPLLGGKNRFYPKKREIKQEKTLKEKSPPKRAGHRKKAPLLRPFFLRAPLPPPNKIKKKKHPQKPKKRGKKKQQKGILKKK